MYHNFYLTELHSVV